MPRKARIVILGEAHHVLQLGNSRQNVFFEPEDRVYYLSLLEKYTEQYNVKLNGTVHLRFNQLTATTFSLEN